MESHLAAELDRSSWMGPAAPSGPMREAETPLLLKEPRRVRDGKRKPSRVEGTLSCPLNVERRAMPKPADGAAELQVVPGTMLDETCMLQEARGSRMKQLRMYGTFTSQGLTPLSSLKQLRPSRASPWPRSSAALRSHPAGAQGATTFRLAAGRANSARGRNGYTLIWLPETVE